jgi:hypothetical protein
MGYAASYVPSPLGPEERQAIIRGLAQFTDRLDPERLIGFIERDDSLYDDLTFFERLLVERSLRENAHIINRLVLEHLLDLLAEGRPDLYPLVEHPPGRVWLQRQVQQLRAIIRS